MRFQRFTTKNILFNLIAVILYVLWNMIIGDIRTDHYYVVGLWLFAFYTNEKTRRFILGFSIYIIYWMIYDSMRIIPNYEVSEVHIREPYDVEKLLFGLNVQDLLLTPNEYFSIHNNKILDFLSGFFYINWIPVPLAFAFYLYIKDKKVFLQFSLVFFLVNLVGFAIYYIYPAAPPWYVEMYGFDLQIDVPGSRAGLERFDELVGVPVFANIYNKNANVLAAIPSLHSAYPVIVLFYGIRKSMGWINILFVIFMLGIWFAAVYSGHHYIIDVILGVIVALITLVVFSFWSNTSYAKDSINRISNFI